jgi:hypothetical protein
MLMCPDAPTDLVELTTFFHKSLGAHTIYFGLMAIGAVVSTVMSKDVRTQCTDKVRSMIPRYNHPRGFVGVGVGGTE